jgi:hypothetical protein
MQYRLLALVVCVACGSVSSKTPDASGGGDSGSSGGGTFTLTVAPHTLSGPIGGPLQASVAVARTGDPGDITLSARDLPAGVTVTFATPTLSTGTNSSDLTVTSGAGAVAGTSMITIVGTANGVEQTDQIQLTLTTITVAGHVQGNRSGVTVGLIGKPSVTSDASGNFTFTDVTPPYSIYTVAPGLFQTEVVIYYDGLLRPDPVIAAASSLPIVHFGSNAPVSGSLSGNGPIAGNVLAIAWGNTGGSTSSVNGSANAYSLSATWPGTVGINGTLYGLQWSTRSTGAPSTFLGYAQTNATLQPNTAATVNLNMTAPTTAQLTGTVTAPTGFPQPTVTLTQQLGNNSAQLWSAVTTTADSTIPVIAAGKSCFFATSSANNTTTSFVYPALTAPTDVSYTLPAVPALVAPADGATGVNNTTMFQITPTPMSVSQIFYNTSGTTKVDYEIFTTASSFTLPMIPEEPLPAGQSFSWSVSAYGPATSVDEAATDSGLEGAFSGDFTGVERFSTSSAGRSFTSQ